MTPRVFRRDVDARPAASPLRRLALALGTRAGAAGKTLDGLDDLTLARAVAVLVGLAVDLDGDGQPDPGPPGGPLGGGEVADSFEARRDVAAKKRANAWKPAPAPKGGPLGMRRGSR